MKKYLILSSLLAMALTACSSMEVDENEVIAENFPSDFSYEEYMTIHPALVSLQIQDYVANANGTTKMSEEDSVAFFDSLNLYKIYTNPYYGGYTVDSWNDKWTEVSLKAEKVECESKLDTVDVRIKQDGNTLTVYPESFVIAEGKIVEVTGYSNKEKTGELEKFSKDDTTWSIAKVNSKMDTVKCDTSYYDTTVVEGLSASNLKYLKKFNFNNSTDDFALLEETRTAKLDTFAISYQFLAFGRSHGWAYRRCHAEEMTADNMAYPVSAIDSVQAALYPAKSLYCVDEDNVNVYELR